MGAFADDVGERLRDELAARTAREWVTEHYVARTPVDVAAPDAPTVLVELEFRRADPANNAVKLARHASEGTLGECVLLQAFSRYYDTESGISSKRANAEFVGELAGSTVSGFRYRAFDFDLDPPKRGDGRPERWERAVASLATELLDVDAV